MNCRRCSTYSTWKKQIKCLHLNIHPTSENKPRLKSWRRSYLKMLDPTSEKMPNLSILATSLYVNVVCYSFFKKCWSYLYVNDLAGFLSVTVTYSVACYLYLLENFSAARNPKHNAIRFQYNNIFGAMFSIAKVFFLFILFLCQKSTRQY